MWVGRLYVSIPDSNFNKGISRVAIENNGFVPFPVAPDIQLRQTTPAQVPCAVMSADTSHPQEAWVWLEFLSRQWKAETQADALAYIPARQSIAQTWDYWKWLPDTVIPAVQFSIEHAWYGSKYPRAFNAVGNGIGKAFSEKTNLRTTLDSVVDELPEATGSEGSRSNPVTVATPKSTRPPTDITVIQYYGYGVNYYNALQVLTTEFNQLFPGIEFRVVSFLSVEVKWSHLKGTSMLKRGNHGCNCTSR